MIERLMFIVTTKEMVNFINNLFIEDGYNKEQFGTNYLIIANTEFSNMINGNLKNVLYGDYKLVLFDILDNLRIDWYIFGILKPDDFDEILETIKIVGTTNCYLKKI
jgi:hypothetical protein